METKVNEGTITSSPGWISSSRALNSRCMSAGSGDECAFHPEYLFQQGVALLGEGLVARDLADGDGLENVFQFASAERRTVEGNFHDASPP